VDITPPVGVRMAGYAERTEPASHVLDPLMAQALVFEGPDGARAALVTTDLVGMSDRVAADVRRIVHERAGIDPVGVIVCASHTHAAPMPAVRGLLAAEPEPAAAAWLAELPHTLAGAVMAALAAAQPCKVAAGVGLLDRVQMNRRTAAGPIDPEVRVLRVERAVDGKLMAAVVNFACHATVLDPRQLGLSADYPGAMRRALRRAMTADGGPAPTVLFVQGAAGDINPTKWRQDRSEVDRIGRSLAAVATAVLEDLRTLWETVWVSTPEGWPPSSPDGWGVVAKPAAPLSRAVAAPTVRAVRREVVLSVRELPAPEQIDRQMDVERQAVESLEPGSAAHRAARYRLLRLQHERRRGPVAAAERTVEVRAVALGGQVVLVTVPGELFVEIGRSVIDDLRGAGAWPLVVGYADDYAGYLPTDRAFDEGGYEVGASPFATGTEGRLREAMLGAARDALAAAAR
jgi:neutral ceramidase